MKPILQPSIRAPEFMLPSVNLEHEVAVGNQPVGVTVLLFFGSRLNDEMAEQLVKYQERLQDFEVVHQLHSFRWTAK